MTQCSITDYTCIPQEELQAATKGKESISIGVPCEDEHEETRTPLTPMAVSALSDAGIHIKIQKGAGKCANYSDMEYSEAGAKLCQNKKDVFDCDIVIKVSAFSLAQRRRVIP